MNRFEMHKDADFLGTIETQLKSEQVEKLFKEYLQTNEEEFNEYGLDDFLDWLVRNDHDTEANRFFVDEVLMF